VTWHPSSFAILGTTAFNLPFDEQSNLILKIQSDGIISFPLIGIIGAQKYHTILIPKEPRFVYEDEGKH